MQKLYKIFLFLYKAVIKEAARPADAVKRL